MNRLIEIYRAMHRQAFMPIFCRDDFDSRAEVEACVAAGCTVIEYTLRRPDAREMIPWVRKNYPDLHGIGVEPKYTAFIVKAPGLYRGLSEADAKGEKGLKMFVDILGFLDKLEQAAHDDGLAGAVQRISLQFMNYLKARGFTFFPEDKNICCC